MSRLLVEGCHGVIQKIHHHAIHLLGIHVESGQSFRWTVFKQDVFVCVGKKRYSLGHDNVEVVGRQSRHRHARITGKLVDQIFQHLHLSDNRLSAFPKNRSFLAQFVAVFTLKSLRGQLHRRERVFDLMRHAPCHFPPGTRPFCLLQLRQILKHNHNAAVVAFIILDHRCGQQKR